MAEQQKDPGQLGQRQAREPLTVLLTGAMGFVGSRVHPELVAAGHRVICTSRNLERAQRAHPERQFRYLDVDDPTTLAPAMEGCQAALYLIHGMGAQHATRDYERAEGEAARAFVRAAEQAGVRRIVYLGGIAPSGEPSKHLRSRLATGEALRSGRVSTIELRATMIVGGGSESWRIVRDLAARLPFMVLPAWLRSQSEPIAIDDVVAALCHALTLPLEGSQALELPGPERMATKEVLMRTARLLNSRPRVIEVPLVSPRLSSYWIRWVTRADVHLARELVEGLRCDIVARDAGYWRYMPEHRRRPFDEAARLALDEEERSISLRTRLAERVLRSFMRRGDG